MNKAEARKIIESALASGKKSPRILDLPEILKIKAQLEASESIHRIVCILEDERSLISNSFGLSEAVFDDCLKKLSALKSTG